MDLRLQKPSAQCVAYPPHSPFLEVCGEDPARGSQTVWWPEKHSANTFPPVCRNVGRHLLLLKGRDASWLTNMVCLPRSRGIRIHFNQKGFALYLHPLIPGVTHSSNYGVVNIVSNYVQWAKQFFLRGIKMRFHILLFEH